MTEDHDILIRLDESINGKEGVIARLSDLDKKLDKHFSNHIRERNALVAALTTGIISLTGLIYRFFTKP